jgi:hypothetical protein
VFCGGVCGGWVREMKLFSWNVRGLGGLEKRREIAVDGVSSGN